MQKVYTINKTGFLPGRIILSIIVFSLCALLLILNLSRLEGIDGIVDIHKKVPWVVLIELTPLLFVGFLFFITSKKIQNSINQENEEGQDRLTLSIAATLEKIKSGNYDENKDQIGVEIIDQGLRDFFKKFTEDADRERNRNWTNEGLAQFRAIMGSHNTIKSMCDDLIGKMVTYINANQAGIFILNKAEETLELISCYAFDRKKFLERTIAPGEGLVGQCFLERETILMTTVPDNYINITSGLGTGNPRALLIVPLNLQDETIGVLEIASFSTFENHTLEFLEKLAEALAQSISSIRTGEETQKLLKMSLQREQEMKDQEERTRQSIEELYVVQEDMRKVNLEMEEVFNAINTLTATVELDQHGKVTKLNDHFTQTLGYGLDQLHGKPLSSLLSNDHQEAAAFQNLWKRILAGKAQEHVFTFHDNRNKTKWVRTGCYPMKGSENKVTRVLCFLTDVSEIKLKEVEMDKVNKQMEATRSMLIKILNEIPVKIFLKQYNGKFFIVNDAVSRFHGFDTPDGLIGKSDFDFYDHKEASEWLEAEHKIIEKGKTSYVHEDGGRILSTAKMPFYIDPLQETGLLGYQADVTEFELCKRKVQELENKLSAKQNKKSH